MRERSFAQDRQQVFLLMLIVMVVGICQLLIFFTAYSGEPSKIFAPDSASYINTARAFLKTGRFAVSPDMPDLPQVIRTPGYPLLIASIFWGWGDENYLPLILTQILLSLGTIIITYQCVTLLFETRIALLAALLLTLDMPSLISAQQVLTETLFTFVLSLAVLAILAVVKRPQKLLVLACLHGICLTCATLIRPIAYYLIFPIVIMVCLLLKTYLVVSWKKTGLAILLLILPWLIGVGGWQLRNYAITGQPEFSYIQGANLLFARAAGVVAERDGITYEEARQLLGYEEYIGLHPEIVGWEMVTHIDQRWKEQGLSLISQYPVFFLKSQLRGIVKMLAGPGERTFINYIGGYQETSGPVGDIFRLPAGRYFQKWVIERPGFFGFALLSVSYLLLIYVGISASFWHIIKRRDADWAIHALLWLMIVYFIVTSAGPEAYSRFRIPIMPVLCFYAGHGLSRIFAKLTPHRACQPG